MRRGEIIGIKSERMEAKGSALLLPEIKNGHARPRIHGRARSANQTGIAKSAAIPVQS